MELENKEICSKCGGMCCKKSGCDYFVEDFNPINKKNILKALETGNISIVAALRFDKTSNGKLFCYPFLYLRARNKDRDIIDLFSMKKACSMLTNNGCLYSFEDRPSGGKNLIPKENHLCIPKKEPVDEIRKWEPYQGLLSKIVKRYTNMSVESKLREDVETVFSQVLNEEFDGISELEILDILQGINTLKTCFPDEYKRALNNSKLNKQILIK